MYEKNANDCAGAASVETYSPLSMGLMIKSENLARLKEVLTSLAYSCGRLGISDQYITKEEGSLLKDEDTTFISRDEKIYQESQRVIAHIEYLSSRILEFSNI